MKRTILISTITLALILCLCEVYSKSSTSELANSQIQSIDLKDQPLVFLQSRIQTTNQIKIKRLDNFSCIFDDSLSSSMICILTDKLILPILVCVNDGWFISNDQSPGVCYYKITNSIKMLIL